MIWVNFGILYIFLQSMSCFLVLVRCGFNLRTSIFCLDVTIVAACVLLMLIFVIVVVVYLRLAIYL